MSELGDRLEREAQKLRQLRDELRVQLDLGKMEARDLWEDAEKSWVELEGRLKRLGHETGEALHDIGAASGKVLEEIRDAYQRLRKLL